MYMLIQATYSSERRKLQHSMQSEKEGVKQQLMASMRELARTQELNSSLQQRISTLNKELTSSRKQLSKAQQSSAKTTTLQKSVKLSQQEIERLQKSVSSERQRYTTLEEKLLQVRTQLEESKRDICESSRELTELRQARHFNISIYNYYINRDISILLQLPEYILYKLYIIDTVQGEGTRRG